MRPGPPALRFALLLCLHAMPAVKGSPTRQSTLPYARATIKADPTVDLADHAASRALYPTDAAARKVRRLQLSVMAGPDP